MAGTNEATLAKAVPNKDAQSGAPELRVVPSVQMDRSRDSLLTEFGKVTDRKSVGRERV